MQYDEKLGESRVRENRTHGLVHGVNVKRLDQVTRRMFTLVEMVVVIVIIATLAAVATPMYFNYVKSSRAGAAKMQIGSFEQCIFDYRVHMKTLPASLEDLVKNNSGSKRWKGPYLKGGVIPQDPWGNDYVYKKPGDHGEFDIISYGADGQPGGEDEDADIGNWTVVEEE